MNRLLFVVAVFVVSSQILTVADEPPAVVKPINLACNTKADEDEPHVTSSGRSLYYSSNPTGKFDIYLSTRAGATQKWSAGKIPDDYLKTAGDDKSVFVLPDGRYPQYLFYSTKKDKEKDANFDIYVAVRQGPGKAFAEPTPVQKVATAEDEMHPWITADGKEMYFSRMTKEGWRVFVAPRPNPNGPQVAEPRMLDELPANYFHATLTPDGKTMYLQGPMRKGRSGLFVAKKLKDGWGDLEVLDMLNDRSGPTGDRSPNLSRDGTMLYFASDRAGGQGGLDLYVIATKDLEKK